MVIMSCMGDVALRNHLPALWRQIEDAHYSYLEIDDSPEKLQLKKKLEGMNVLVKLIRCGYGETEFLITVIFKFITQKPQVSQKNPFERPLFLTPNKMNRKIGAKLCSACTTNRLRASSGKK